MKGSKSIVWSAASIGLALTIAVFGNNWLGNSSSIKESQMANTISPFVPLRLSKEYVYVGDRLVAVDESSAISGVAPGRLVATASSNVASPPSVVTVSWEVPPGAIDHYQVERIRVVKGQVSAEGFQLISPNVPVTVCSAREVCFSDAQVIPYAVYVYRARAVFADGGISPFSNIDIATTFTFRDDPLNSNGVRTPIRALHFIELRDAVNCVRVAAGLPLFNWTGSPPIAGGAIYASHYNDLSLNLGVALNELGLPAPQAQAASINSPVTAVPVQQLRDLIR